MLTPPGVTICFEATGHQCSEGAENVKNFKFCAYHSIFPVGGATYVYADDPYDQTAACVAESPNESPSDDAISGGLAHEHSESVTDPELTNGWFNEKGDEVADICRSANPEKELGSPLGTAPDGAPYNQLINGHEYLYQQMWSNERGACVQRVALPPTLKKLSPKKGPTTGKTRVTIVGSGFVGPVSVYFGANPGTEVKLTGTTQLTVLTPPESAGEVSVTVHTEAGVTAVSKKTVFKYKATKVKK